MPRGFNDDEKQRILQQLLECGRRLFGQYGVRKTSLDDIVKCAGIAKGSFYQFFPSKELLFFALVDQFQQATRIRIKDAMAAIEVPDLDSLTDVIVDSFRVLQEEPMLRIMLDQEEYQSILHKIPREILEQERESDIDYASELYHLWQERGLHPQIDLSLFTDMLRILAMSMLQSNMVQSDFQDMTRIIIKGILIQTFPEGVK